MLKSLFCALASLLLVDAADAQTISAPSVWTNQRGSVLTILFMDSAGNFQGTYVNNASDTRAFPTGCGETFRARSSSSSSPLRLATPSRSGKAAPAGPP